MAKARKGRDKSNQTDKQRSDGQSTGKRAAAPWKWPLAVGVIGAVAFVAVYLTQEQAPVDEGAQVKVRVPELSSEAQEGQVVFSENCVTCHGDNAAGTRQGPPLVHRIYEPSHHGNAAFRRATKQGVRAHHWSYGNMPPIGISDAELSSIIQYVRELQRANGIS